MTPAARTAYNRLLGCIRASKHASARAAEKAAAVDEARTEFDRIWAEQERAA